MTGTKRVKWNEIYDCPSVLTIKFERKKRFYCGIYACFDLLYKLNNIYGAGKNQYFVNNSKKIKIIEKVF